MSKLLKTVVVGCGGMANSWVKFAIHADTIELVGLVDLNRDAAVAMAQKHGLDAAVVFDSLARAVKATGAEAVFDVTVPVAHDKVTLEALSLGCHVLGEKPMSDSLQKARAMVAKAKEVGKVYAVTQTRRPIQAMMAMRDFVAGGGLGRVAEVHSDFFLGPHFGGFREEMEHPLLVDMAIHTFDNARQITGADPVSVYCHGFNPAHSWFGKDASAVAIFEMSDGLVYCYRGSWCAEGLATSWNAAWRLVGEKGSMTCDGNRQPVAQVIDSTGGAGFDSAMKDVEVPMPEQPLNGHEFLITEFADHVLSGGKTRLTCPCEDNIKSLAMVIAAVKSSEAGQKVAVEF